MNPEHKKYILENMGKKSPAQIASEIGVRERYVKNVMRMERIKVGFRRAVLPKKAPPKAVEALSPKAAVFFTNKTIVLASIALIIILGAAVYANSLNGKFVYDDDILITNNSFIKGWPPTLKLFTANMGTFSDIKSPFYRPIQMITYAMDYRLWKLNVVGYHLANIILHILVALCVYWLVNILFEDKVISVLTAVFFVVHPIHTTVVSYISTRAESLYLLFMLISFISYIKSSKANNPIFYIIMLSSYCLSLLSKENAIILPFLLLLYHFTFKEKIRVKEFLPISAIAVIYIVLRLTVLRSFLSHLAYNEPLRQRIPGFFVAIAGYVRLLFLPFGLHMEYGVPLFNLTDPRVILGLVILGAMIFCIFKSRKTNRLIFFSLSWFVVTLLPVSNLYPLNAYMSENWLYLPSIGLFLVLAGLLSPFFKKEKIRTSALVLTSCLLLFYSVLTVRQNQTWADPMLFYERTLKYAPDSSNVYANLGSLNANMGKKEDAIAMFKKAIEINPDQDAAYSGLGVVYAKIGKREEAIAMLNKAIELNPNNAKAYYNLGIEYDNMKKIEEAIPMYKKALEINPDYADAYNNLGIAYYNTGKKEDVIDIFKKAIESNPSNAEAYNNLGFAYYKMGKTEDAIATYKKAIEFSSSNASIYNNLSLAYYKMGNKEEAIAMCKKVIELNPDNSETYNNLGILYYNTGKKEDAIATYKNAIELSPNYAAAYNNLGVAYYETGRQEEAAAAFKKALEINPNYADARRNLEAITAGSKQEAPQ